MKGKSKWFKPQISRVRLLPEEAVLAGCKVASTGKGTKCDNTGTGACYNRVAGS